MAAKKTATARPRRAAARAASNATTAETTQNRGEPDTKTAKAAAATPGPLARARREDFPRATASEFAQVRDGKEKADNDVSAPRPQSLGTPLILNRDADGKIIPSPSAAVVAVTARTRKLKGFREETVVATRMGYYGLKRRRAGEVFQMGFVGDGYLPSWVRLAEKEDLDPVVSRSRQVTRTSTGQEIIDDIEEDAGTEVPLALGGNQRRPTDSSGDVL